MKREFAGVVIGPGTDTYSDVRLQDVFIRSCTLFGQSVGARLRVVGARATHVEIGYSGARFVSFEDVELCKIRSHQPVTAISCSFRRVKLSEITGRVNIDWATFPTFRQEMVPRGDYDFDDWALDLCGIKSSENLRIQGVPSQKIVVDSGNQCLTNLGLIASVEGWEKHVESAGIRNEIAVGIQAMSAFPYFFHVAEKRKNRDLEQDRRSIRALHELGWTLATY